MWPGCRAAVNVSRNICNGFNGCAERCRDALSVHLERGAVNLAICLGAPGQNGEGMRQLLQQPGYIQAGYSLLNVLVAAQRKILQHRPAMSNIAMNLVLGVNVCDAMALPMEDEALVNALLIEDARKRRHPQSSRLAASAGSQAGSASTGHRQKANPLFGDEPWWVRDLEKETGTDEQAMRLTLRGGGVRQ